MINVILHRSATAFRELQTLKKPIESQISRFISSRVIQKGASIGANTPFKQPRLMHRSFSIEQPKPQSSSGNGSVMMKGIAAFVSTVMIAKVVFAHQEPFSKSKDPVQDTHLSGYEEIKGKDLPRSLLATLRYLPADHQATLFMRHGERLDLPSHGPDNVLLTPHGKEVAKVLGRLLSIKEPGLLVTSPKGRCVETLTAIIQGSSWNDVPEITQDKLIAPSNPFIIDLDEAIESFKALGGPALFNKQITDAVPPKGMGSTAKGVKKVLDAYVEKEHQNPNQLNIAVTHDAVLTVVVGYLCDLTFTEADWPEFLNGVLLWRDSQGLNVVWRGNHRVLGFKKLKEKQL